MFNNPLAFFTLLKLPQWFGGIDIRVIYIAHGEFMHTDVTKTHYLVVDDLVFWSLVLFVFRVYSID